jgi:hypothetical protein
MSSVAAVLLINQEEKSTDSIFTFFVFLGARNGDTVNWYLKTYPKRVPSVIWAFEANPQNFELMDTYWQKHKNLDIHIIKKAAWIDNKGVEFTLDNRPDVLTGRQEAMKRSFEISKRA